MLALEGISNSLCPYHVYRAPPGRASLEGTAYQGKSFPSYQGWVENALRPPPLPWLKPVWAKRQTHLQQRCTRSTSPPSLEVWELVGPVEYVDGPNAPVLITVADPVAWREGAEGTPADACYKEGSSGGDLSPRIVVPIQPSTDTIWMETRTHLSSQ